jgi:hypothetical protein
MSRSYLLLIAMVFPFVAGAQNSEPVKASKNTKEAAAEQQIFTLPDNIKLNKKELNERVENKTMELTRLIKALSEKKETDKALVAEAMKLFNNNEYALVSVTRKNEKKPVTVPVRTYLSRLNRLKYDKVNILWHNATYVSNFTRQPNGTYMGLVAVEQEFTGIMSGEANYVYKDRTQKRVEVTVKVWDAKDDKDIKKQYLDVFLGNIGVTEE